MKKFFALMFAALLMLSSTTSAETIQATGVGLGPKGANPKSSFYKTYARQAARLDAFVALAHIIHSSPSETVEHYLISSKSQLLTRISSDLLKTKKIRQVGEAKFYEDACEITMEMDI